MTTVFIATQKVIMCLQFFKFQSSGPLSRFQNDRTEYCIHTVEDFAVWSLFLLMMARTEVASGALLCALLCFLGIFCCCCQSHRLGDGTCVNLQHNNDQRKYPFQPLIAELCSKMKVEQLENREIEFPYARFYACLWCMDYAIYATRHVGPI